MTNEYIMEICLSAMIAVFILAVIWLYVTRNDNKE